MATNQKTVFFLGAGFSKDAGGPIQNELIETIFTEEFSECLDKKGKQALSNFKAFLKNGMYIEDVHDQRVSLEDIITPIDRCIWDGRSFGSFSHKKLVEGRSELHFLLAKAIQYRVDKTPGDANYIKTFTEYICSLAKKRVEDPNEDNVAIITTNWDILLDNQLNKIARSETDKICEGDIKKGPIAVVDYCCHISSLEDDDYIKPGLFALGRNGYNIKYLKLHGSMNWLHCPRCQRLYVKFLEKTMFQVYYCKHCQKDLGRSSTTGIDSIRLQGNLLLPSFIKDLRNIQLQLVWYNAGIELSEATRIVFIGYSLPAADYEIRQLLSRFVGRKTKIEVVIYPSDHAGAEERRYRDFWGNREVFIWRKTVPEYISELSK